MNKKIDFTLVITGAYYSEKYLVLRSDRAIIKTDAVFMEDDIDYGHALMTDVAEDIVRRLKDDAVNNKVDAKAEYGIMNMHCTTYKSDREVEEEEPED